MRMSHPRVARVALLVVAGAFFVAASALALGFSRKDYPVTQDTLGVVAGDFNRDGHPDLIAFGRDATDPTAFYLQGRRQGTFAPATAITTRGEGFDGVAGQFNGDHNLDFAYADVANDAVVLLTGKGNGKFRAARSFAVGPEPQSPDSADFNRDGIPDIAVADNGTNKVSVLLGARGGGFRPEHKYPVPAGADPYEVETNDFNGDHRPDIATANDQDNSVSVLLGRAGGFRSAITSIVPGGPEGITSGDFNGDGKPDLAAGLCGNRNGVDVLLGKGNGTFGRAHHYATGECSWRVETGRINRDKRLDIVSGNQNSNDASVLLGKRDGTFRAARTFATAERPGGLAVRNFDHRGGGDIAVATQSGDAVTVLRNAG